MFMSNSSGDHHQVPILTSIRYSSSNPTWKEEDDRVENIFLQSQATININMSQLHQLITQDDHPFLLGEVQTIEPTLSTSELRYSELLFEIDMVNHLDLNSKLHNYDEIPAEQLFQLNRYIKSACSSLADVISKEKLEEISIEIKIEVVRTELCSMQDFIDQQADHHKLVPAAPFAVEALKTKKCDEENLKDPCTICQEEFMTGEDVTLMPCSHIFHKDCVECWLKRTNTCPLCRFAMPTT